MTKEINAISAKITKIFARAVENAQQESRDNVLPNVFYQNGQIVYELPNGKFAAKRPK